MEGLEGGGREERGRLRVKTLSGTWKGWRREGRQKEEQWECPIQCKQEQKWVLYKERPILFCASAFTGVFVVCVYTCACGYTCL